MQTITFTQGIQGSGKSTWAKKQCKSRKYKRVCRDDLRLMFDNTQFNPDNEKFITTMENLIIKHTLISGYSVIVDSMNLNQNRLKERIFDCKQEFPDVQIKTVLFNEDLEECIKRDSSRINPIGEEIITNTYNRYKEYLENL